MIKVYYAKINDEWREDELEKKISCLPADLLEQVMKYKNWRDRQLSIAGKLLLLDLLKDFKLSDKLDLKNLHYTRFDKPYLNNAFDFNISHTQNLVVCAATTTGNIGIDIEKIQPVTIEYWSDYFTIEEIEAINKSSDKHIAFYRTWTKKEAFIKAIGKGLNIQLSKINTVRNVIAYEHKSNYLHQVTIEGEYVCYVCCNQKEVLITTTEIRV
jgi:4'-phosphopantetheinyl transferase